MLNLYLIRNKEGKFFRPIGHAGYGDNWVSELVRAKIYTKIGPAKSQITWWFKNYPDYGCPDLIEFSFDIKDAKVIDMLGITQKSISKIVKKELRDEINKKEYQRKVCGEEIEKMQKRMKELE